MNDDSTVIARLAATLRQRTPGNGHLNCDAIDPCDSCRVTRDAYAGLIPLQRRRSA